MAETTSAAMFAGDDRRVWGKPRNDWKARSYCRNNDTSIARWRQASDFAGTCKTSGSPVAEPEFANANETVIFRIAFHG
jgi:hypothetical protein